MPRVEGFGSPWGGKPTRGRGLRLLLLPLVSVQCGRDAKSGHARRVHRPGSSVGHSSHVIVSLEMEPHAPGWRSRGSCLGGIVAFPGLLNLTLVVLVAFLALTTATLILSGGKGSAFSISAMHGPRRCKGVGKALNKFDGGTHVHLLLGSVNILSFT